MLMALPAVVQNTTFTWTKMPATFFILTGVAFLAAPTPVFPRRLAGWLSLTAGMLAHYSTGPWLLALAGAELVRNPGCVRRWFTRPGLAIGAACVLLFGTWLGWSLSRLGAAETFGSNSTVLDGTGLSLRERVSHAARNLYYTSVPVLVRKVEPGPYKTGDAAAALRQIAIRDAHADAIDPRREARLGAPVAQRLEHLDERLLQ